MGNTCNNLRGNEPIMASGGMRPRRSASDAQAKPALPVARSNRKSSKKAVGVAPSPAASPLRVSFSLQPDPSNDSDEESKQMPETEEDQRAREDREGQQLWSSIAQRDELVALLRSSKSIDSNIAVRMAAAQLVKECGSLTQQLEEVTLSDTKNARSVVQTKSKAAAEMKNADKELKRLREENAKLKAKISGLTGKSSSPPKVPTSAGKKRRGSPITLENSPMSKKPHAGKTREVSEPSPAATAVSAPSSVHVSLIHTDRQPAAAAAPTSDRIKHRADAPSNHALIVHGVDLRTHTSVQDAKLAITQQFLNAGIILDSDKGRTLPTWCGLIPQARHKGVVRSDLPVRWKIELMSAEAVSTVLERFYEIDFESRMFMIEPYAPSHKERQDSEQQLRFAHNLHQSTLNRSMKTDETASETIQVIAQDGERIARLQPRSLFGPSALKTERTDRMDTDPPQQMHQMVSSPQRWTPAEQYQPSQSMQQIPRQHPFVPSHQPGPVQYSPEVVRVHRSGPYQPPPQSIEVYAQPTMQYHAASGPMYPQQSHYSPQQTQYVDQYGHPVHIRPQF
jgi:hypothetical protein